MSVHKIKCHSCGYEWIKRVGSPKACPECKTRLKKQSRVIIHGNEADYNNFSHEQGGV